jgi:hypothetical protein
MEASTRAEVEGRRPDGGAQGAGDGARHPRRRRPGVRGRHRPRPRPLRRPAEADPGAVPPARDVARAGAGVPRHRGRRGEGWSPHGAAGTRSPPCRGRSPPDAPKRRPRGRRLRPRIPRHRRSSPRQPPASPPTRSAARRPCLADPAQALPVQVEAAEALPGLLPRPGRAGVAEFEAEPASSRRAYAAFVFAYRFADAAAVHAGRRQHERAGSANSDRAIGGVSA